jgi:hypothetical protein
MTPLANIAAVSAAVAGAESDSPRITTLALKALALKALALKALAIKALAIKTLALKTLALKTLAKFIPAPRV